MEFPLFSNKLKHEHELRVLKVREAMQREGIDALLIASTVNLLYITGGVCRGYYYLPLDADPIFFVVPPLSADVPEMVEVRKPEQIPAVLAERGYDIPKTLGIEMGDLIYSDAERLRRVFPASEMRDATRVMRAARLIKTALEVSLMEEDGVKQSSVYAKVGKCFRPGMTDTELQIEIERLLRLEGCLGYPRVAGARMEINLGSLLAGENADEPSPYDFSMGGRGIDPSLPVGACGVTLRPGMAVMVDMNGGFNSHQSDMTRCWCVEYIDERAQRAHDCSREILRDLEEFGRPGAEIGEMYRRAVRIADSHGLKDYFMGHRHKVAFIGHGVGIELNEGPVVMDRNKARLEEGMTIALEPKFVIPGIGALGIENTYVVADSGLRNLTKLSEELGIL